MPYVWRNWFRSAFERAFKLVHLFIICLLLFLSALLFILFFLYVYVTKYNLIASHLVEFRGSSLSHWCGREVRGMLVQLTDDAWRISLTAAQGRGGAVTTRERSTVIHPIPTGNGVWTFRYPWSIETRVDWRWQATTIIQRSALTMRNEGASKTWCIWYSTELVAPCA